MTNTQFIDVLVFMLRDVVEGKRKSYEEYAEHFNVTASALRGYVRTFTKNYPRGQFRQGLPIPDEHRQLAEEAYNGLRNASTARPSKKEIELPYEGVRPRRVWEAQTKGGEIAVLHSYEYDGELQDLQKFREKVVDEVLEKFRGMLDSPAKSEPMPKVDKKQAAVGLMLYTSDKHSGACNKRSLYGYSYNGSVFRDRLLNTLEIVRREYQLRGTLDTVRIVDLGDGLDGPNGTTTRGGHPLTQNMDGPEQFETYLLAHIEFFDRLISMQAAANIELAISTNDNHGGFGMYVAARALEVHLNAKYPQIKTYMSRDFMFQLPYGMHRFVYCHGKDEQFMKRPFPLRLDADTTNKIEAFIDYHGLGKHLSFEQEKACIHFVKGDLHQSSEEYSRRFRYKNIMSMYGSSPYIEHNFGPGYSGFEYELVYRDFPELQGCRKFNFTR